MMYIAQCPFCFHEYTLVLHAQHDIVPIFCEKCKKEYLWKWETRICARLRVNGSCQRFCTKAERFVCSARFRDGRSIPQPEKSLEQEEQEAAQYIFRSGRYQGKTIEEVYMLDEHFLYRFLSPLGNVSFQRKLEKALRYLRRKK